MKAYFEYISENENSFRRFRIQWILAILVLSIFSGASFYSSKKNIRDYNSENGIVETIHPSKVRIKPTGTYDLREFVEKDAIEIRIKETSYYVRYQLEKHKGNVFQKIHPGDTIDVYYARIENHLELYEILKNGESILDYSERKNQGEIFLGMLFGIIISIIVLTYTIRLRKNYLGKKGAIF